MSWLWLRAVVVGKKGRCTAVLLTLVFFVAAACGPAKHLGRDTAPTTTPATQPGATGPLTIGPPALLRTPPKRVDLGTLGGSFTSPTAMSGSVVVGESGTAGDDSTSRGHAFVYDLAAVHPHMVDLGTLGGRFSSANAVDGTWVVGAADSADGIGHPFAYNLAAAHPHMIDLGSSRRSGPRVRVRPEQHAPQAHRPRR